MKRISSKLILLFLLTALVPMAISYSISIYQLKSAIQSTVVKGNRQVAEIAALNVENYFNNAMNILTALSLQLGELDLGRDQERTLVRNTFLDHQFFQSIEYFNGDGNPLVTSAITGEGNISRAQLEPIIPLVMSGEIYHSDLYITDNPPPLRPAIRVALPVGQAPELKGFIVSEINLITMWHMVNHIKIDQSGAATILNGQGNVVASSDLGLVFDLKPFPDFERLAPYLSGESRKAIIYGKANKGEYLLVSSPLHGSLKGSILIEQPTDAAFRVASVLTRQLIMLALIIMALMVLVGYLGVKWEILRHLNTLMEGIGRIGHGEWNAKVHIRSRDEFKRVGDALNRMTDHLQHQAGEIRRQERLTLIGRIAGSLVHDLKHPIQNIRNWTKLLGSHYEDETYRANFQEVVNREFRNVDEFFSKLKDLTGDISHSPMELPVGAILEEIDARFRMEAKTKEIDFLIPATIPGLFVKADRFSLIRILSNLTSNALQATPRGGQVTLRTEIPASRGTFRIIIEDTGHGIAPEYLKNIFQDFMTTKRKGLGLGLALTRKLVEMHGGSIEVFSIVGQGTRFEVDFPRFTVKETATEVKDGQVIL